LTASPTNKLPIVRSKTREELRARIAEKPDWINKLSLEIDTMGEDWLLALQDELTKSYFLNVS